MLSIHNLHITVDDKEVVKGVTLKIRPGEIHALMGPNGSGKSSLAMAIVGHPRYQIKNQKSKIKNTDQISKILLDDTDIADKTPDERTRMGLFLAMQYPTSIDGITVEQLLRRAVQEKITKSQNHKITKISNNPKTPNNPLDLLAFRKQVERLAQKVGVMKELLHRPINVGFSGGEKKRLEILQMLVLRPKYAILDETDSGLDIDALKRIAETVKMAKWLNGYKPGVLVITHYARLLKHLKPDVVHVMKDGRIVESGGGELAEKIERKGYQISN